MASIAQADRIAFPPEEASLSRVRSMEKNEKLSALLVMLGPDSAAKILKLLDEAEVEEIVSEISKLTLLTAPEQKDILKEFAQMAIEASASVSGGVSIARKALERSVGLFKAAEILDRIAPAPTASSAIQQMIDMEPRQLFNIIKREQDQTIALIISHLDPPNAAEIVSMLRGEKRVKVLERLATLSPTSLETVEKVVEVVLSKTGGAPPNALNRSGGVKAAAAVLNSLEKNLSKNLLFNLEEQNADLGQAIKNKMFTFDDLAYLDPTHLQKIVRDIDLRDMAVALKTASDRVKKALLACLSTRASSAVEEEMEFMGPLKLDDIESAQNRIIESVRELENNDEIDLSSIRGARRETVRS